MKTRGLNKALRGAGRGINKAGKDVNRAVIRPTGKAVREVGTAVKDSVDNVVNTAGGLGNNIVDSFSNPLVLIGVGIVAVAGFAVLSKK